MEFKFKMSGFYWKDIAEEDRKCGYWVIVPLNKNDCFDGQEYEIAYLCFDKCFQLKRINTTKNSDPSKFLFLGMISEKRQK